MKKLKVLLVKLNTNTDTHTRAHTQASFSSLFCLLLVLNISDLGSRGIVHVLSVAKKGADQLRGYRAFDLLFA